MKRFLLLRTNQARLLSVAKSDSPRMVCTALVEALEGACKIEDSAAIAYSETDPAERIPKSELVVRYQKFALADLEGALGRYHALEEAAISKLDADLRDRLSIVAADSMLAADRLSAAISRVAKDSGSSAR